MVGGLLGLPGRGAASAEATVFSTIGSETSR
eukprot:CAMPEP_0195630200 /NCGR_PEP_ID=MMETSP0815-20121206/20404_1 /TAXON_ID=97485 /ORGANISM="Prymnesium parvum, Strain Texoma1" /LENGTH=30 /DNA_ID= /DNA_START= /DNA_END= /DNA_ORIENTATION=